MNWRVEHSQADSVRKGKKRQRPIQLVVVVNIGTRMSTIQRVRASAMSPSMVTILM